MSTAGPVWIVYRSRNTHGQKDSREAEKYRVGRLSYRPNFSNRITLDILDSRLSQQNCSVSKLRDR